MSEYIIEIESFASINAAKDYAKKHIKKGDKAINIVSRDITVIELQEAK